MKNKDKKIVLAFHKLQNKLNFFDYKYAKAKTIVKIKGNQ